MDHRLFVTIGSANNVKPTLELRQTRHTLPMCFIDVLSRETRSPAFLDSHHGVADIGSRQRG